MFILGASFFRGESWIDRDHVQREVERWCVGTAGLRLHGTTRKRPLEVFEAVEKPALLGLERPPYDPPAWAAAKVHPDHHVQFQKAFYSAPTRYVGKKVWVRGDTKLIRLFVGDELVATHPRVKEGKRSTFHAHYPPERADYALRDVDRMLRQARAQGPRIGRFMARLLAGDLPWSRLRQAQKLLRLCQKYGTQRLDQACGRALAFDLLTSSASRGSSSAAWRPRRPSPTSPRRSSCTRASRATPHTSTTTRPRRPTMEITTSLKETLKRLKLSGMLPTLPERIAYAKKTKLTEIDFLELVLHDEVERRDHKRLALRLDQAGFEEEHVFESFDWDAPVTFDRDRVRDLFSLGFLERHEDVLFMGPVGVGKTFLAGALGHAACRAGHRVLFLRTDRMFHQLHQARADLSTEKAFRRLLAPDLLILDDFGLRRLDREQSSDLYELILERHRRSSTLVTSNRAIEEWIPLFDDPILAQSALDRLAHNAYQVVIEGESYRKRQRPGIDATPTSTTSSTRRTRRTR